MKIGPNERCPCGSGRKYKRCCKAKDDERRREEEAARKPADSPLEEAPGGFTIAPYTIARVAEEHDPRARWTITKVAAMTTEAIEAQLRAFGVAHTRERFLELAKDVASAWSVSQKWTAQDPVSCKGKDPDFLGLAACELWKRWLPECPSVEMIDDWMQEGYAMEEDQRGDEACEIWWKVWRVLLPRFAPEMRTMQSADAVFLGTQSIFNWCQDFEMCLHNASLDEQRWATVGLQYCTEWLGQFTDESEVNQVSVRRAKAGFHFALGEAAEGEVVLRTILDRWPKNVWGYVGLADAYSHLFYKDGPPVDYPRAIGLLEQGLAAVDKGDRDREALQERLAEIRKRAGAPA